MIRQRIETLASDLLAKSRIASPPVPVQDLAVAVGATLRLGPLEEELSGFLLRRSGQTIIGVNSLHARTRQRFTIGHELGHLLLHNYTEHIDRGISFYFRDARSSTAEIRQEIEANQFAAELLMPRKLIDAMITTSVDLFNDIQLTDLAAEFDVSVQALTYRLTNLGFSTHRRNSSRGKSLRKGTATHSQRRP